MRLSSHGDVRSHGREPGLQVKPVRVNRARLRVTECDSGPGSRFVEVYVELMMRR